MNNNKKVLFIINEYSGTADQHLFHVIHLIQEIAKRDVKIGLIIEKCHGEPPVLGDNIRVSVQKETKKVRRVFELQRLIREYISEGFEKIFVRISTKAEINAFIATKIKRKGETYFWFSGANYALRKEVSLLRKIKNYFRSDVFYNFAVKHCTYFVTGPETMVKYYHEVGGVPCEKIKLLYNDIDLTRFTPPNEKQKIELRKQLNLEENCRYVLFVHRFSPVRKSSFYLPYIIDDVNLENVRYIFIGGGPDEQEIREKLNREDCIFLGSCPNNIIQQYYQACDLFINPSYCEGFPRVIIEAMACGLPIVTTNAGGTGDLFGELQSEFVVDIDDRDLFKEKIVKMLNSPQIMKSCANENLTEVKKYSTEAVADMYINMFFEKQEIFLNKEENI